MLKRISRIILALTVLLGVDNAIAYFTTCPSIASLKNTTIFSDASCTKIIAPGSTFLEPDKTFEVWIGGGSWLKVDVNCEGMGADSADNQGSDKAEYFYFALNDESTHQCTATFDKYSFTNPPYKTITWSVKRDAAAPPTPTQTLTCAQLASDPHSPLTFRCSLLSGSTGMANVPIYYKLRTTNASGVALNAFNVLLNNAYHTNDSTVGTGGDDASGTLITGVTDADGASKIRTFVDFAKMIDSFPPSWFPTERYPITVTVYASTSPTFAAPSAQFDLKLDSLGMVDQVWVAEGPGCLKSIDCTPAVSIQPNSSERRIALDTYRARTDDSTPRLVLRRSTELGEREMKVGEKIQSGDIVRFNANGIVSTYCPGCYPALLPDGTVAPDWVYARLSFWDGVKGILGADSQPPGTYEFGMGTLATSTMGTVPKLKRWGSAAATGALRFGISQAVKTLIPVLGAPLTAKSVIEWSPKILDAAEAARRTMFVVINSEIYSRSTSDGVSKLTTIEGQGVLYPTTSDTSLGTVSAGKTAEFRAGQIAPTIRPSTADEEQEAHDWLDTLASGCSQESQLHSNINPNACSLGSTATFSLAQPTSVSRLGVWYNTKVGGSRLAYTIEGAGRTFTGTFVPVGCDPYQSQWCMGEASLNQTLGSGTYTITTAAAAVCRNAASTNVGFSVVYGCALPKTIAPATNYQGLWWNPAESGWGINFAHQGDLIFATWYTYGTDGKPWWLISTLKQSGSAFSGDVYTVSGQAFNSQPWLQSKMKSSMVGTMTLTFSSANKGSLTYTINGVAQTKAVEKQLFGTEPACVFGFQPDLTTATNYTDIWWNPSESGWGINLTHQSDTIYATWFTYDASGKPWWLVATMKPDGAGGYSGSVSTIDGPPFSTVPWDQSRLKPTNVGTMTARFTDGNHANLAYTVNGVAQTKAVTRQVFVTPGTVCK